MGSAHIRFSTEILRRLGEELNPSLDRGVIELVKNAYDADARKCEVVLSGVHEVGGSIEVRDDGDGMDLAGLRDGWLVLGSSSKALAGRTRLERVPTGSKGLGRLAALRMGRFCEVSTCPLAEPLRGYDLKIDWRKFDKARVVEDVDISIKQRARRGSEGNGTVVSISELNVPVGRMDVKRLARGLILLADPFGEDPLGFRPTLAAPEFRDLEKLVKNRYFEEADYHLVASVNGDGICETSVVDWRGDELFKGKHEEVVSVRNGASPNYECPAAKFDLWAFILNRTGFGGRTATLAEVREWLAEFGGVHLYENGLRVAPYGNPGNDWLDLNLSRSRSPEERPSTNTSIGRVAVVGSTGLLQQKTDRSGYIETHAFEELKRFARDCLDWMAKRRLEEAEKRRSRARATAPKRSEKTKKSVEVVIESAPTKVREQLKTAFSSYEKARDREVRSLQREVQLYRTLSTAGITAATFAHESSGNPLKIIALSVGTIERRAKQVLTLEYDDVLAKPIGRIKGAVESLEVLSSATLRLVDHEKRRVGRVDVHRVIKGVLETFEPFLRGRDVEVTTNLAEGEPYLRGSEAAIESIITNLLNNSLVAFERAGAGKKRIVSVATELQGANLVVRVSDNGPGIMDISVTDVWLPGETTRANGTGLGLTIVRDAVSDLGGKVEAIATGSMGGAEFVLEIPVLGR